MARKGGKRAGEFLRRLVEIGEVCIAAEACMAPERSSQLMRTVAQHLANEFGGQTVYVSRDQETALAARDAELFAAFDGRNTAELALRYRLSERQVGYIVTSVRQSKR